MGKRAERRKKKCLIQSCEVILRLGMDASSHAALSCSSCRVVGRASLTALGMPCGQKECPGYLYVEEEIMAAAAAAEKLGGTPSFWDVTDAFNLERGHDRQGWAYIGRGWRSVEPERTE